MRISIHLTKEARTKRKTLLSSAFSQRENHWITLPMNKLRLSKVGLTICHARSSITTPLILFLNLSYLILQFIQENDISYKYGKQKIFISLSAPTTALITEKNAQKGIIAEPMRLK